MKRILILVAVILGIVATAAALNRASHAKKEIEEVKKVLVETRNFEIEILPLGNQDDTHDLIITGRSIQPGCGTSGLTVCGVQLLIDEENQEIIDLLARIGDDDDPVTVADFLAVSSTTLLSYSKKN